MEEKDRLTNTSIEDVRNNLDAFDIIDWEEDIFNKLAEYEKTGLEPEEVEQLKKENEELKWGKSVMCISVVGNCCNLEESYGEICVNCNSCGRFNEKTANKCYLKVLQERLIDTQNFNDWVEDLNIRKIQETNIKENIKIIKQKIKTLKEKG